MNQIKEIQEIGQFVERQQSIQQQRIEEKPLYQQDFAPASLDRAKQFVRLTSIVDENQEPYPLCSDIQLFGRFSIGIQLYMNFLKKLTICLFLMTLIAMLAIILNYLGSYYTMYDKYSIFDNTTLGNQRGIQKQQTDKQKATQSVARANTQRRILLVIDLSYCLVMVFFIIAFKIYMKGAIKQRQLIQAMPHNYSIEVKGLPKYGISEEEVKNFFQQRFGAVIQVIFGRQYGGTLKKFKTRAAIMKKIQIEKVKLKIKNQQKSASLERLENKLSEIDANIKTKHPKVRSTNALPINRAYIIFNNHTSQTKCLDEFRKQNNLIKRLFKAVFCMKSRKNLIFQDQYRLRVSQPDNPSSIKWENLELSSFSRCCRSILVLSIGLACFILCFVIILKLKLLQTKNNVTDQQCQTQNIDSIQSNGLDLKGDQLLCWCKSKGFLKILTDKFLRQGPCQSCLLHYIQQLTLMVTISLAIVFTNFFLKLILRLLAICIRYKTIDSERSTYMTTIFTVLFINTGILILLINADFNTTLIGTVFQYIPVIGKRIFAGEFQDFTRRWYLMVGSSVIIILTVNIFLPPVTGLMFLIMKRMQIKCCRRKKLIQLDLNNLLKGNQYDIVNSGATTLANIYIALLYAPGCPILIPVLFILLLVRYWTDKYLLLRHYCRPPFYDEKFPKQIMKILPFSVFLHLLFGIWYYTEPNIFPVQVREYNEQDENGTIFYGGSNGGSVWSRVFNQYMIPYYIMFGVIIFSYFFSSIFISFCKCKSLQRLKELRNKKLGTYLKEKAKMRGINSYDPKKNDQYRLLMISIDKMLQGDQDGKKLLATDHSTNILIQQQKSEKLSQKNQIQILNGEVRKKRQNFDSSENLQVLQVQ